MSTSKKRGKGHVSSGRTTGSATKAATSFKSTGATGKTTSSVSGRFVPTTTAHESAADQTVQKKSATAREGTPIAPAVRGRRLATDPFVPDVMAPGLAADIKALITEPDFPKGALDKLVEGSMLHVITGIGKSETFTIGDDLASYMKALRAQFDEVVLPSVLARLIKGAVPIAPEDLAERMLAVAPAPAPANKMAEQVGPEYYDTNGVKTILAAPGAEPVSKQAVEHRRNRHTILALQTTDRRWIYPTWQFRDHDVVPGLADVLAMFYPPHPSRDQTAASGNSESGNSGAVAMARSATRDEPFSRWSVATWVTTSLRELDGLSVADCLLEDRDRDWVVRLARRTAVAWAA